MPDGQRRRRHSNIASKRRWYAFYRSIRFNRRFGVAAVTVAPCFLRRFVEATAIKCPSYC